MTGSNGPARTMTLRPIMEIAANLGLRPGDVHPYGAWKAKIAADATAGAGGEGKLILVTAISPTPAGEGKTTTTIGLGDALNRIGKRTMICLREPSLGPCFGMKGGATGGGRAQVAPMEDINLHFTGDFHAITAANNLLSALVDNHIHFRAEPLLDPRRVTWRRVLDMNDRSLREIVTGLGGPGNGTPREAGFDITAASEVMAILCLAEDLADLEARLGRIVVGETRERDLVTAADIKASGAMAVLLRDALLPNLVQTLENNPALVHGGPFANIAHGCNSVIATRAGLRLADYVVTEAGFGADLGAEKFFDIKCRQAGLRPAASVVVATIRALKMHGGVALPELKAENLNALRAGFANLARHVENVRRFGVPVVVAVNEFATDTAAEVALVRELASGIGVEAIRCTHFADGGAGAEALAEAVAALADGGTADFRPLYPDDMPLLDKVRAVATAIYGAADIAPDPKVTERLQRLEMMGFGRLPVCIAKTQYSFSTDPDRKGAPSGHVLPLREARLSAGAGFVVVLAGEIMTMPGLPRIPAANGFGLDQDGRIVGFSKG
ncbi:MAG: formate--tetrahydrofolate ligase [Bauldia sp.]|nr:formate--tetrahydrofolate ligase [Bauldia sp.]MCW5719295.1 formate--tetrahydrofolate ligase [Bauldia sp.]